jgi:predicted AAA+ superfamily ATPase
MKYLSRIAEKKFLRMSENFPVVLVTGARQAGKTTMLEHLAKGQNRTYVSLDDLHARTVAKSDPVLFFQTYKTPIIIDEVQYAPNLFSQIKLMADKNKLAGEFWLTGSQSYDLMRGVSESLAGRIGIVEMSSFVIDEVYGQLKTPVTDFNIESLKQRFSACIQYPLNELFDFIYQGGMPKAITLGDEARKDYFYTYIHSYLMRDVMELGKVSDIVRFNRFLTTCAANLAGQLSYSTLAAVADISQPTAKEWLGILQGLGIVHLLQPYFNNEIKRLVKTSKLYFYDTGLAAYLSKWPSAEALQLGNMSGAYFENFIINQFAKKFVYEAQSPNMFYYRDIDQKEIDIVLESYNGLTPIEIKLTSNPHSGDVGKFKALEKFKKPINKGALICTIDKVALADSNNALLPVWLI